MKKQSFLKGAAVLAAASVICKILSAVLKIPLDRLFLHEEGIGVYQSAYSIYNVFLAICVTGIPIGLSGLVAGSDEKTAASLVRSTFVTVSLFGVLSGIAMFFCAKPVATLLSGGGEAVAAPSLMVLSPALLAMGFISSRKGYFQGIGNMTPSAMGQIGESIAKVFLGIGVCAVFVKWGISYGAAGAICGVTVGAFVQAAILEISFRRQKKEKGRFSLALAAEVFRISLPMTLGAFGFTAVMLADTLTVPGLLSAGGVEITQRLKEFGYLTRANTIYNLPATIISAFTASAVPALAFAKNEKDEALLGENAVRIIKLVFLAAFPCGLGMMLFCREIFSLIYNADSHSIMLALTGALVIIMPFVQTSTAMLQTLGKVWTPIWVSVSGVLVKIFLNAVLIKHIGAEGALIATVVAFVPVAVINILLLMKKTSLEGAGTSVIKVFLCALLSCGLARAFYILIGGLVGFLGGILLAGIIYIALIIVTKCITKEDF